MANKKISELTTISELLSGYYIPVAVASTTYKVDYLTFINNFVSQATYDSKMASLDATDASLQAQIDALSGAITPSYLSTYSNVSQQSTGSPQAMNLGTVDLVQNLELEASTKIRILEAGIYNIQFSAQYENRNNAEHNINIWLMKDSAHVDNTNTLIEIPRANGGDHGQLVAAWNFLIDADAESRYELYWQCTSTGVWLINYAANGAIPATPSVIVTVTKVN